MDKTVPREFLLQIGAKIGYYRRINQLSQQELAARIQVTPSVISRIERGTYNANLSFSNIFAISKALNIDPTVFLTFSDYEKSFWSK